MSGSEVENFGKDRKIPTKWKTVFVLMNTNDVPDGLRLGQRVLVITSPKKKSPAKQLEAKKTKKKASPTIKKQKDVGKTSPVPKKRGRPPKVTKKPNQGKREKKALPVVEMEQLESTIHTEELTDDTDKESIISDDVDVGIDLTGETSCSDEGEDWMPAHKKAKSEEVFFKSKKWSMGKDSKSKSKSKSKAVGKPRKFVSLTSYSPPVLVEETKSTPVSKSSSGAYAKKETASTSSKSSKKTSSFEDKTSDEPLPNYGDFFVEKATYKDGDIPYLWQYQRGGLIQKFDKVMVNGMILYQNILCFSDWWPCFNHKYQRVEVKTVQKFRNLLKVRLTEEVIINQEESSGFKEEPFSDEPVVVIENLSPEKSKQSAASSEKAAENTQEQEVSSTTPDMSNFQVGDFVLDKKDEKNIDSYPIWKIEKAMLLQKYLATVKNGKLYHEPMRSYRGYKDDIAKFYKPIKVRSVPALGDEFVEVLEDYKPVLVVDISLEEEYDQHPLLPHFYVYLQVYLSQALEPGFVLEIYKSNNDSYLFPISEIDKIINQKIIMVERKCRWTQKIQLAMKARPYLREVSKPNKAKICEALKDTEETVEENVFFFGPQYDPFTLELKSSSVCEDFNVGARAVEHIRAYHNLCHFKFNLFAQCEGKINLIKERKHDAPVTEIMDACLGNKDWVIQKFEEFMKLIDQG